MSRNYWNTEVTEPPKAIDATLLDRYVSGNCTTVETAIVQEFLEQHPMHSDLVQAMHAVPAGGIPVRRRADVMRGWNRFLEQRQNSKRILQKLPRAVWYSACGLAAMMLVVLIGYRGLRVHAGRLSTVGETVYATRNGERADITLPDGSTVTLNAGSSLHVPVDFAAGHRMVSLLGEALFSVQHQRGQSFAVLAGGATTRVLGTAFVVRHYATDTATMVAVRDGKVAVQSVVLTARHRAIVGRGGIDVGMTDTAIFGFASGVLALDDVSLRDAALELNRWYDADIRIPDDALASRRIKGTFATGSLADLSEALSFTFNLRVIRNGRVLTLFPR